MAHMIAIDVAVLLRYIERQSMPTEVTANYILLENTRCGYCGKMGHRASHHPDYEEWRVATLAEYRAAQSEKRLNPKPPKPNRQHPPVQGPLSEQECLWCGDTFSRCQSQMYCSRECFWEDRRERTMGRLKEKEAEEREPPRVLAEVKLQHEPGQGFEMSDLSNTVLSCSGSGEVSHPFTVSELEKIALSDRHRIRNDPWEFDWEVVAMLKPPASGIRRRARKQTVKTKKTPCQPPSLTRLADTTHPRGTSHLPSQEQSCLFLTLTSPSK